MIEEELYTHLKDNVASVSGRVHPNILPQASVKPALVYTVVSDTDNQGLSGCVSSSTTRFQVDVYADSYISAKSVKNEVKAALYLFSRIPMELNTMDGFVEGSELFRQIIDFKIRK